MTVIRFTIPGPPRGKGQRSGSMARRFKDAKTRTYEAIVAMCAKEAMAGQPPIEGPVELTVAAVFPIPKSRSKRWREDAMNGIEMPIVRPDHSNIVKAVEDGINGIVWRDDAQVVSHGAGHGKRYGGPAAVGVHVTVRAI